MLYAPLARTTARVMADARSDEADILAALIAATGAGSAVFESGEANDRLFDLERLHGRLETLQMRVCKCASNAARSSYTS